MLLHSTANTSHACRTFRPLPIHFPQEEDDTEFAEACFLLLCPNLHPSPFRHPFLVVTRWQVCRWIRQVRSWCFHGRQCSAFLLRTSMFLRHRSSPDQITIFWFLKIINLYITRFRLCSFFFFFCTTRFRPNTFRDRDGT